MTSGPVKPAVGDRPEEGLRMKLHLALGAVALAVPLTACSTAPAVPLPQPYTCTPAQALHGVPSGPVAISTFTCTAGAGLIASTVRIERRTATGWTTIATGPTHSLRAPATVSSETVQYCHGVTPEVIRAVATDVVLNGRSQRDYAGSAVSLNC